MESKPLVVVGAGAAGTAAAIEAARAGVQVTLIDENPISTAMMGLNVPQFFGRRYTDAMQDTSLTLEMVTSANDALSEAQEAGVDVRLGTCVWGAFANTETSRVLDGPQLGLSDGVRSWLMKYDRLIVAAGARDLGIPFAGWDLTGSMGANGAYSLMSRYDALSSRRIVVLGSGSLGLNTAIMALDRGIEVPAVVDVSPIVQGDEALLAQLRHRGVALYTSHTVREAIGTDGEVESVVLVEIDKHCEPISGSEKVISADTVCLAIGLVPNVELLSLLGCELHFKSELGGHVPNHDNRMRTSVANVFVAGDVAGFHDGMTLDIEFARSRGRLAGIAAAQSLGAIDEEDAVARMSDLRPADSTPTEVHTNWRRWLKSLVNCGGPDIFVCQCEEVTFADLIETRPPRYLGWESDPMSRRSVKTLLEDGPVNPNQVKRLTRAGTGECQGRLCREQVSMLLAEESGAGLADIPLMSYRPPLRPLPLKVMWPHEETEQVRSDWPKWFSPTSQVLG
ncbi:MAG: NAD(P)/FAD-dependent oxidoreductase [Chloroflexi bacterium]|nr:NAD(P)/FAD-dependent oxidoreductase [Chloroflexota bacterium]